MFPRIVFEKVLQVLLNLRRRDLTLRCRECYNLVTRRLNRPGLMYIYMGSISGNDGVGAAQHGAYHRGVALGPADKEVHIGKMASNGILYQRHCSAGIGIHSVPDGLL